MNVALPSTSRSLAYLNTILSSLDQLGPTNLINSNSAASKTSVTVTLPNTQSPVLVTVILNATVSLTTMKPVAFKLTFTTVILGL